MTRRLLSLLSAALVLAWAGSATAAIPRLINFQGRLADASGTPKTGSYSMIFSIWNAASGGASCFSETQAVAANSGLVNVQVGGATSGGIASGCDFSVPYWIQVQVGSDSPMSPRIQLTAAAYAMRAEVADNSVKLNGLTQGNGSGQVPSNNGTVQTSLNADLLDGLHASGVASTYVSKALYDQHQSCSGSNISGVATCTSYTYGICYQSTVCYNHSYYYAAACPSGCTDGGQACQSYGSCQVCDSDGCYSGNRYRRTCICNNTLFGYVRP